MLFRTALRRWAPLRRGLAGLPELTKNRYPVKRGDYATLENDHIQFFKNLLGDPKVITEPSDCEAYNIDWIKNVRGYSSCVLKPKTTKEVSKILEFCNERKIAVCPQGGNTGLVGGSVPVFDEVVLSTSLMNNVISTDDRSGVLVCQAGCVLETLDAHLGEHQLMMPLDLGAKGTCQIGGNVSTNAGGLRLLRYGNLHGSVLGLEVVKADGEILDLLSTLKKDNTGYHLKHLFIGSEGSLGIITKVAIQCPPKPKAVNLAFLGLESFDNILKVLRKAKHELAEILSSCEMIDERSLDVVTTNLKLKNPLSEYPFYMLIETHGSDNAHDEEKLQKFLENLMQEGLLLDGTSTSEPSKMKLQTEINFGIGHFRGVWLAMAKVWPAQVVVAGIHISSVSKVSRLVASWEPLAGPSKPHRAKTVTNIDENQANIWDLRERITEGLVHDGYVFKYDISLPLENFYSIVTVMKERVGTDAVRVSGYGHLGDGNLHLNISVKEFTQDILKKIEPFVYEYTSNLRGSISAEHGIGFRKPKYMKYSKSQASIKLMKQIKQMMDPKGILNPYKVLPP